MSPDELGTADGSMGTTNRGAALSMPLRIIDLNAQPDKDVKATSPPSTRHILTGKQEHCMFDLALLIVELIG